MSLTGTYTDAALIAEMKRQGRPMSAPAIEELRSLALEAFGVECDRQRFTEALIARDVRNRSRGGWFDAVSYAAVIAATAIEPVATSDLIAIRDSLMRAVGDSDVFGRDRRCREATSHQTTKKDGAMSRNRLATGKSAACQVCHRFVPLLKNDPEDGDAFAFYARHHLVPPDAYKLLRHAPWCEGSGYYVGEGPR